MIPSMICLPLTNPDYSGLIRLGRISFNLLAITFEMILYITLHKEMGLNLLGVSAPSSLGMRVKKVALKSLMS